MNRNRRHISVVRWGQALKRLMASSSDCKTQTSLARKSGVAQSTIGRILRGDADATTSTMAFLADAFGMSLTALAAAVEDEMQITGGQQ